MRNRKQFFFKSTDKRILTFETNFSIRGAIEAIFLTKPKILFYKIVTKSWCKLHHIRFFRSMAASLENEDDVLVNDLYALLNVGKDVGIDPNQLRVFYKNQLFQNYVNFVFKKYIPVSLIMPVSCNVCQTESRESFCTEYEGGAHCVMKRLQRCFCACIADCAFLAIR